MALGMLSRRELTRSELRQRLLEREVPEGEIDGVLDGLAASGFLASDEEIVARWLESRASRRRLGTGRLAREASRRGLDRDLARQIASRVQDPELERRRLDDEVERAIGGVEEWRGGAEGAKLVRRLVGRLERRGFPPAAIRDALARRGLLGAD